MKTKFLLLLSVFCLNILFCRFVSAENFNFIFWYPGEAGSTEIAQPTIDSFTEYINKKIAGDKISGKYFNTDAEGITAIQKLKPKFAIVSFAAFEIYKDKLKGSKILLRTLPLPDGKETEKYTIIGKGPIKPLNTETLNLFSKQPLTNEVVKKYIIKNGVFKVTTVPSILALLKDLASGAKKGAAILQPIEYATLVTINQPWAKDLTVWQTSKEVPSAPLLVYGENSEKILKIKDILLKMSQDAEGKTILETLRLKGFADAK